MLGIALSLVACTSAETDEALTNPTSQVSPGDGSVAPGDGDQDDPERRSSGEPSSEVEVVLAEDEGISEQAAEEPVIEDSVQVEIDFEDSAEAEQVRVGVGESALCATLQIGRDAAVDGDDDLADTQRDLLIERTPRVEDGELAAILSEFDADEPLDVSLAEEGLLRCQALGFEI